MTGEVLILRLLTAVALALMMFGAVAAWVSANALKRIAGGVISFAGALLAGAALGAPVELLIAGLAAAFAFVALGVAVAVRLQEGYGAIEAPELDQADAQDEAAERAP